MLSVFQQNGTRTRRPSTAIQLSLDEDANFAIDDEEKEFSAHLEV